MAEILQTTLPYDPFTPRPLPGIAPLDPGDWLHRDEAFAGQLARRDVLLADRRAEVLALDPEAADPAQEVLDLALEQAYPGAGAGVVRPDGVRVAVDRADPLGTLGRLVQEDICILQKRGDEHVLTGAVLCFPASWTLEEKFLRPLTGIHEPVDSYDAGIARRVQRLFDGVRSGRPLWRFNALWYDDPELHQPRSAAQRRDRVDPERAGYLRSERQCILRLPRSNAVVFSIHTYVLARASLAERQ
ncbi:Protein of unknown function [Cribrihabitans marinus]|uniref:DUF3445 domain-containing protein n=1 Tax=Cribrihabitans marinus TaxID=1227549 RepID=A0A1H6V5M9_9RHOB|nr:DUF3445 domain-containing protein [Cribrihabitans marinus]GGH26289.1 hypothetical protein GCM10010973_13980 [Cribrihabitans marinus]SEI99828.1 Protein of unknown function [Cribrihabitans marinus]